ncbi:MAG: DUF4870 domain-containing protein [Planctomycetota bacterium]
MEATSEDRTLAMIAHLLGIFTGFIGPLVVWIVKRDEGGFVEDQAREALNFQITVLIAGVICGLLVLAFIGILLIPILAIGAIILPIVGCVKSYDGQVYRYPLTLRLLS